jgi:hypothetical protein
MADRSGRSNKCHSRPELSSSPMNDGDAGRLGRYIVAEVDVRSFNFFCVNINIRIRNKFHDSNNWSDN